MTLRKIIRTLFHPTTIKIVSVIFIVWFFFVLPTYAQTAANAWVSEAQKLLNTILSLCSRWWIILAIIAGKLMTNDRVYASIIHMDIYLWKIRNIMKNFANFGLIAIVLRNIIQNLVGKNKIDIKGIITKTLIAGILIQASRFLVGAVVDISTIATTAVGAFPSSFLQSSPDLQEQIRKSMTNNVYKKYEIDLFGANTMKPISTTEQPATTSNRESILPTYNSVSWPLIYLWFSVFKFQNYMNTEWGASAEALTISFLLRFVLIFLYTIGLALLLIANIIRVAFLRIFVIASPLLVLSQVFFKDEWLGWKSWWIGKYLKFSVMIDLVFKPVIFVAGFSMILILVTSIQSIMQGTLPKSFNGVTVSVLWSSSTLAIEGISTIQIQENDILGKDPFKTTAITETWQTIFVNLLIFFLTTFLIRQFIKMAVTSGKWSPISEMMSPMVDRIEKSAKTLPILPMWWGMSVGAMNSIREWQTKKLAEWFGVNKAGEFGEMKEWSFEKNEDKFNNFMADEMGLQHWWTDNDYNKLNKLAMDNSNYTSFFDTSRALAKDRQKWLSVDNKRWMANVESLLRDNRKLEGLNNTLGAENKFKPWTGDTKPETYFNDPQNIKALYSIMWWNEASKSTEPTNYAGLQKITFYHGNQ
ncbi:MAG: hypothetical protein ACD_80C00084G0022 [uncultured bacterium (gcode 4)]|uniref:Uncharacterized protein n=1 Tax=uncultured bacterium (gcode 4) TaxID=1234023 RepID=K1XJG7_9BACT|nr:MAG: hypothetical protein ACD_80C00084G0022 [uncultured bacterium (gcode 4)]